MQYASQQSISRVRMPIGGMTHPPVPGTAEFERLGHGSTVLVSPPLNRTMAMRRALLYWVDRCEIGAEKAKCVIACCAGLGLDIVC